MILGAACKIKRNREPTWLFVPTIGLPPFPNKNLNSRIHPGSLSWVAIHNCACRPASLMPDLISWPDLYFYLLPPRYFLHENT
jgi:hypothetical protein